MKNLFLLLTIVFGFGVFAQTKYSTVPDDFITFHDNVSSAERMFKNDSLLQAYAKFDIAFSTYKGGVNPGHYFNAAICAIKIKEEFKALHFIEKAIVTGYELDSTKKTLIDFYNQNTKKEYLDNVAKWEEIRDSGRNTDWENELVNSVDPKSKLSDVKYFEALEYCLNCMKVKTCSKTAPNYVSKYKIVKNRMRSDSVKAENTLSNIQKFGFPTMKLVGKNASDIARNTLLNYDADKKNERLDGILSKALSDGNISPEFYASLIDRRNSLNGLEPEFYEPITGYEKTIGKNLGIANKKRKTIGLYPIKIVNSTPSKTKNPKTAKKVSIGLYDY